MRSLIGASIILFLTTRVLSQTKFPECVQTCITDDPVSSFCDGDETGADLDKCTCESLSGSLLVKCIQACPDSDQSSYAATVPESCRDQLFPGVTVTSTPTATGGQTGSTGSGTAAATQTASTTSQSSSTATPDAASDHHIPGLLAAGGLGGFLVAMVL